MIGRTTPKLDKTLNEFRSEGIVTSEAKVIPKNMDFNEPTTVEKDFQNVIFLNSESFYS